MFRHELTPVELKSLRAAAVMGDNDGVTLTRTNAHGTRNDYGFAIWSLPVTCPFRGITGHEPGSDG
jgi:hypothetical protein